MKNNVELRLVILDETLQLPNDSVAPANRIVGSNIRLEDDGAHGLFLVGWIKVFDNFCDVADAKQFMSVEELALAIVREKRGENTIRSALPALVFASSASLGVAVTFCCSRCCWCWDVMMSMVANTTHDNYFFGLMCCW